MFFVTLLKEKRDRLFWSMIGSALFVTLMFVPVVMQWMNAVVWIPMINLAGIPFIVCQLLLLSLAARRGNLDARLLLGPFGLQPPLPRQSVCTLYEKVLAVRSGGRVLPPERPGARNSKVALLTLALFTR